MENRTPDVSADDQKSPDQIEQEMFQTRDSITEKVAALENQVLGTIQTATNTVSDTVQAVREAVTSAPNAVRESVKQAVGAVKESVASFSVSGCIRDNPVAALGTSTLGGFLLGYLLPGDERNLFRRPIMAQGHDAPAPRGRAGTADDAREATPYRAVAPTPSREPEQPGFFGQLWERMSRELGGLAEQALSTAVASLKQSISTRVPQAVDTAVGRVTERVAGASDGTCRVGGRNYAATPPTAGV